MKVYNGCILAVLCLFMVFPVPVFAASDAQWTGSYTFTGADQAKAFESIYSLPPQFEHTVSCDFTVAGAFGAATVVLQASDDPGRTEDSSATWYDLGTHALSAAELTAESTMFHVTKKPAHRFRVNITATTGTAALDTVTCYCTGVK